MCAADGGAESGGAEVALPEFERLAPNDRYAICVSFSTRNKVVSSPIWTFDSSTDSHGPWLFRTLSTFLTRHRLTHSQNPTEFSIAAVRLDAVERLSHVRRRRAVELHGARDLSPPNDIWESSVELTECS